MDKKLFTDIVKQNFCTRNWYYLYYVLAAFDVAAICVSLYASNRNLKNYNQSIEFTDSKIKILSLVGEVSNLAQKVNAPGNDVFESKNVAEERERFSSSKLDYENKFLALQSQIRLPLKTAPNDLKVSHELNILENIKLEMAHMGEIANKIFDHFEKKEEVKAAVLMAEMDRRYAKLQVVIEGFRRLQTEQISSTLLEHHKGLNASKALELYISILVFMLVLGVSIFGTYLNRFVKKAFADAQRNRETLQSISEAAIVAFTDTAGKITEINDNFCKISGYSREELIGQDHRMINSGAHPKIFFKELWQKISTGGVWTGDIQNTKKSGEDYFVRTVISPIKGLNGEIEQFLAIRFDITEQKRIENELLAAQRTAKIGSWKYDLLTGRQTWSSEHYRIFEIDEPQSQENLFKLYRERIHPEDRAILDQVVERAIQFGEDICYNHRVYLDNGSRIKHVRGVGKVTKDSQGRPIYVSGTCQDLTEIVALQEQNRFVLESMGIGIWKFNPHTQDLFWDQSMYDLYELNPKDFSGHYQAWESSLSPEAKHNVVNELELALSGKKEFDTTFEILTKSGGRKYLGGEGIVIRNEKHEPTMMYGINWDKTNETKLQVTLNKTLALLESTGRMAKVGGWELDLETGRVFMSEQTKTLHEIDENFEPLNYSTGAEWYPPDVWPVVQSAVQKALTEGIPYDLELPFVTAKKRNIWVRVQGVPLYKDSKISGLVGTFQDISEKRVLQEQVETERIKSVHSAKLASLGEMAAGIAHEINNPLALIAGNVPLISKFRNDDTKFNSKLETIAKSADRIEKIVKGLKKFSRTTEGSIYKSETIASLVSEALILTEAKSKRHFTPIETYIEPDLAISCDGVEIEQVLVNLINNGIDAVTSHNERWIKINAFSEGEQAVLQVIDSGEGISEENEGKLFQPFFTTKVVGEGTGLGLSIAKGILDSHKASFALNRSFKNTCFEVRFAKAVC